MHLLVRVAMTKLIRNQMGVLPTMIPKQFFQRCVNENNNNKIKTIMAPIKFYLFLLVVLPSKIVKGSSYDRAEGIPGGALSVAHKYYFYNHLQIYFHW